MLDRKLNKKYSELTRQALQSSGFCSFAIPFEYVKVAPEREAVISELENNIKTVYVFYASNFLRKA